MRSGLEGILTGHGRRQTALGRLRETGALSSYRRPGIASGRPCPRVSRILAPTADPRCSSSPLSPHSRSSCLVPAPPPTPGAPHCSPDPTRSCPAPCGSTRPIKCSTRPRNGRTHLRHPVDAHGHPESRAVAPDDEHRPHSARPAVAGIVAHVRARNRERESAGIRRALPGAAHGHRPTAMEQRVVAGDAPGHVHLRQDSQARGRLRSVRPNSKHP